MNLLDRLRVWVINKLMLGLPSLSAFDEEERKLWLELTKEGDILSFRFKKAGAPIGVVFQLKQRKVILRARNRSDLMLEPYW